MNAVVANAQMLSPAKIDIKENQGEEGATVLLTQQHASTTKLDTSTKPSVPFSNPNSQTPAFKAPPTI